MQDLLKIGQDIVERLSLQHGPVGVTLYTDRDPLPPEIPFSGKELKSYCQALILAGAGDSFLLEREKMGCKLGTSVLGFEDDMDGYLDDGVLEKYGVGLFGTEEASSETILKSTYLAKGKTRAALIAPLSIFEQIPQVVIFTANSEQVMWLLYAVNYQKGGLINLPQSGGALGGCSDITALPLLKGIPNITFLGLGCRLKSAIGPGHLMMGINGSDLAMVHTHIVEMAKPIAMLNRQQASS
ncbi:hypothetical protein D1BOALGB6SA_8251 [Olavius sp. associated proteobacterium Delta 1]|nr:hypothetical protein D1BOALGB6SA_8251 [Olavius sp. associated proteobacterium Delta 1]